MPALAGALAAGASGEALNLPYDFAAIGDGAFGRAGASRLAVVGARQALRGDRCVTVVAVVARATMDAEAVTIVIDANKRGSPFRSLVGGRRGMRRRLASRKPPDGNRERYREPRIQVLPVQGSTPPSSNETVA